ncbi:tRNA glutamyl-Q(34) synthetase GluQRS [Pelobacter sp. M08fum]|uniref:Glutamyl-Q tRNA(Asp) synthetase n=2 Tax=Pelovirga terrestris TaxID=2771352 RepID=A0A8J6UPE8_9BACT|nr:tRNA glutamyl-Q(34) synthetase GluQRS [Pelovirga terrestris]
MTAIVPHSHSPVIGRFAPSPTGPLHFGTLVAAVASYLQARRTGGRWLVRIEDLDPPRVVAGSAAALLLLLEELGFEWDGPVVYQSTRFERYQSILEELRYRQLVFDCGCSRREILASAPHPGEEGPIYPGTCRHGVRGSRRERSVRLRVEDRDIHFVDGIQKEQRQNLEREVGDFVLYRADGVFAYQLAVVIDDMDAGVTHVVRGADLLFSTPRQIRLYHCLGAEPPAYFHHPLVLGADGQKLSKRDGDYTLINQVNGAAQLWRALAFLGQTPPPELLDATPHEVLGWGLANFSISRVGRENRPLEL